MSIASVRRITTLVTGVGGSPYYVSAWFDRDTSTVQACIDAWHSFVTDNSSAASLRNGTIWNTLATSTVVDVATGEVVAVDQGAAKSTTGTQTTGLLPLSNQFLVRWGTGVYLGGRALKGKTNIPLPNTAASTADGAVTSTAQTAINGRIITLLAATPDLAVYSKTYNAAAVVTTGNVWSQFSVLRSRRD